MALFGKRAPSLFELPYDLREDIRAAIDRAPQDAVLRMRTPGAERSLEALNKRSPAQEVISAMVYCVNALTFAKGYLAVG